MIRKCTDADFETIFDIINESAQAYKGVIPGDRWHDPYMTREALQREIEDGIVFWGIEKASELLGVMGIQDKEDVTLIRHSYVRTRARKKGIGTKLLDYLENTTNKPVLIGTWADATWAISFYQKNGYRLLPKDEKTHLLLKYWSIPERQVETSVVLANRKWMSECD